MKRSMSKQELYHIEQIADARKLDAQGRCALRQRLATPILDSLKNGWNRLMEKYHQEVAWDKLLPILILFGQE